MKNVFNFFKYAIKVMNPLFGYRYYYDILTGQCPADYDGDDLLHSIALWMALGTLIALIGVGIDNPLVGKIGIACAIYAGYLFTTFPPILVAMVGYFITDYLPRVVRKVMKKN